MGAWGPPSRVTRRGLFDSATTTAVRWAVGAALMLSGALPLFGETNPLDLPSGYPEVQRAFLREDFERVTTLAQTFILEHSDVPQVPRVWLWLALSLDRLQRSNEALTELDRLKRRLGPRDPLWPELLFWEGDVSRRSLQMVRAKMAYERLLEQYPDSSWAAQARLGLGLTYLHQQAFEAALPYFRDAASRYFGSPAALDARLYEGVCHLQLKQFQEAATILESLLEELKERGLISQAALYLGESLSALNRYDYAARAYRRVIDVSESAQWSRLAQFGLGWVLYQAGRCKESVDAFEWYLTQTLPTTLAASPAGAADHRTEALFAQGSCFIQLGREPEAQSRFEQILSSGREHPLVLDSGLTLASLYRRQERFVQAKELLHGLLRRISDPTSRARVHLQLGSLALEQGNAAQAKTVFELASESDESSTRQAALSGLGDVQMFLGRLEAAQRFYERAVRVSEQTPLSAYGRYQLGRIQLQLGAFPEAVKIFQELSANTDPALADDARLALALAYLRQGEDAASRSVLEAIRQQRPTSVTAARAAYYLALSALGEEDSASAQHLCEEAVSRAPKSEEALDARLLLADLLASRTSLSDAIGWLRDVYLTSALPRRQRAKLAKRVGDLARMGGTLAEAIGWYETAMQLLPSLGSEATYRIASCYEEGGDIATAINWYQRVDEPPWRVRGQLAQAKLLEREGREEEAQTIYRLLAGESIPEAKIAQERLAALREAPRKKESRW